MDKIYQGQKTSPKQADPFASSTFSKVTLGVPQLMGDMTSTTGLPMENHVGRLGELCQAQGWPKAEFVVVNQTGLPHQPLFTIEARLSIRSKSEILRAQAKPMTDKKGGSQVAAGKLLELIARQDDSSISNSISTLFAYCAKNHLASPRFEDKQKASAEPEGKPIWQSNCIIITEDGDEIARKSRDSNKQFARTCAARDLLEILAPKTKVIST